MSIAIGDVWFGKWTHLSLVANRRPTPGAIPYHDTTAWDRVYHVAIDLNPQTVDCDLHM